MKILLNVLKYLFLIMLASTILFTLGAAGFFFYFSKDLPNIITVHDYKPNVVTRVLGKNDRPVGEFFEERRYVVPMEDLPNHVIQSFVAAEDDRFFEHQGIDFLGMLRAAFVNFRAGHVVQGGSTITQQVAKSLLLTPERSFSRKIREVIIANRMEKNLSKKEILYLYLNQIYFGEGAYGVETAANIYFNKTTKELTLPEAALLAGLPQAPSRYTPLQNPKRAKERQLYVLHRLKENKVITEEAYREAANTPIKIYLYKSLNQKYAPHYVENIRKYLIDKYGKEKLYNSGLVVKTPIDPDLSIRAVHAVRDGLRMADKRHGYRGPVEKLSKENFSAALKKIFEYNIQKEFPYRLLLPNGTHATELFELFPEIKDTTDIFKEKEIYKGLVQSIDDKKKEAIVDLGVFKGILTLDRMRWAVPAAMLSAPGAESLSAISKTLSVGNIVLVRLVEKKPPKLLLPTLALEQEPEVQGALLSMDHTTGEVLTMVGAYDFEKSEFNRAVQAERQTGSAFKPVIYSAAVDKGYTPVTVIQDSPLVFTSTDNEKWKPLNYDEHFSGDTLFRTALIRSMNIPTIKIVQDIGIPYLIEYAKRLGITKGLNPDYSIALGSSSISLLDLCKVYAIYPRGGRKIEPVFINRVLDREGSVLEENLPNTAAPAQQPILQTVPQPVRVSGQLSAEKAQQAKDGAEPQPVWSPDPTDNARVLDPRTAYIMTHLMTEVTTVGTGAEAKNLKRAAAGKTGTTNDYIDAWFIGFTPQVTTGVWVGFDSLRSLGPKGTGGATALPIWLDYMQEAVKNYPDIQFAAPPGVTSAYVHGVTGKSVSSFTPGAVKEVFFSGTEPNQKNSQATGSEAQSAGGHQEESQTEDFLKEDFQ